MSEHLPLPQADTLVPDHEQVLTAEAIRKDSLDRLRRPQHERTGTEVINPVTGEAQKPCFNLEIDAAGQQEVADTLAGRTNALSQAHSVLDSLPQMRDGKLVLEPLPQDADTLEDYTNRVQAKYSIWATENITPYGAKSNINASDNPAEAQLQDLTTIWRPGTERQRASSMTVDDIMADVNEHHESYTTWRNELATTITNNKELIDSGAWPSDKAMAEIFNAARKVDFDTSPESVRQAIQQTLANKIGLSERGRKQLEESDATASDVIVRTIDAEADHDGTNGSVSLGHALGLREYSYDIEGKTGSGVLADAYITAEDVAAYVAIGERLDAMLGKNTVSGIPSSVTNQLTAEQLADRVTFFSQQLIPAEVSLIHATSSSNTSLPDLLDSGKLLPRRATGKLGDIGDSATGVHSNYVHFTEPGKITTGYGDMFIALPIGDIIEQTPYHQAELNYSAKVNTQEKFGAITIDAADAPLAVADRMMALNQRFSNGIVVQPTHGNVNNLSFAASSNSETADNYAYDLNNARFLCDEKRSVSIAKYAAEHGGRYEQQVVIGNSERGHGLSGTHGVDGFVFEKPIVPTDGKVIVYGPLSQRQVGFSENSLGDQMKELAARARKMAGSVALTATA